jgi:hypothetical protein
MLLLLELLVWHQWVLGRESKSSHGKEVSGREDFGHDSLVRVQIYHYTHCRSFWGYFYWTFGQLKVELRINCGLCGRSSLGAGWWKMNFIFQKRVRS